MEQNSPDYYFNEDGLMVMTASYLLKRGKCCGNGCTHCPFEYENVLDPDLKKELNLRRKK